MRNEIRIIQNWRLMEVVSTLRLVFHNQYSVEDEFVTLYARNRSQIHKSEIMNDWLSVKKGRRRKIRANQTNYVNIVPAVIESVREKERVMREERELGFLTQSEWGEKRKEGSHSVRKKEGEERMGLITKNVLELILIELLVEDISFTTSSPKLLALALNSEYVVN